MKHSHSTAAMKHPDKPGEGAKKRAPIKDPKKKIATVMEEFKHGTLHSGKSKAPVSNPKQAIAIGLRGSEVWRTHPKEKEIIMVKKSRMLKPHYMKEGEEHEVHKKMMSHLGKISKNKKGN